MTSRIESFRAMVAKNPDNALSHFGLANEALKAGLYEEAATHFREYLGRHQDEGNAYGKLAEALERMGMVEEARDALRQGIEASLQHGHPTMADEMQLRLEELDA